MRRTILIVSWLLVATTVTGQDVLRTWDFEQDPLAGWKCKSNASMAVQTDPEHGQYLQGTVRYGEFGFGWFTHFFEDTDFRDAWAVELDVKGDGQGGTLAIQLGRRWPERSIYYINNTDAVTLDFQGWRRCRFLMPNFATPGGRDRQDDLSRIFFLELMVGSRTQGTSTIGVDTIRVVKATPEQQRILRAQETMATLSSQPPPEDGANGLPNSSFELDVSADGQPDFWGPGAWNTGSTPFLDKQVAHEGTVSVAVTNTSADQRGSWNHGQPLSAGYWVFRAWYRTESLQAGKDKGVDARLTLQDADGQYLDAVHARGQPTRGAWQQVEARFEAPPDTARVVISLFNFFASGTVWWDDIHLGADAEGRAEAQRRERENRKLLEEVQAMTPDAVDAVKDLEERLEQTADAALLVAALTWAVEDAGRDADAELGAPAKRTLDDVMDMVDRADQILRDAAGREHPTPVEADDGNPYVKRLNQKIDTLANDTPVYAKGEQGYREIDNAWTFRRLGEDCAVLAWGLLNPRSARFHDPRLLRNLLVNYDVITRHHRDGDFNPGRQAVHGRDPNINRFCISPMMDSLLMLEKEYPWLILPSKREEWREQLRILVEYQYETFGPREALDPERPRYYPNMDVHYLLIMEFAWQLFEDETYRQDRDTMLTWLEDALYPDGAWTYHWPQNECYVYHALNVTFIARYYELTGDERARRILDKSRGYYPLVHDSQGMTESYTDCSWKHYWTRAHPQGPDLIAGMFGDRRNKRAAVDAARNGYSSGIGGLYTAPWWRDLEPEPMPERWLVYDRNVLGPRGQNGVFRFAGTARPTPLGEIGKDTFVGCMIGDKDARGLPLDAALQVATIEYRLKPEGPHWHNARYCSSAEEFSVIMTPDAAALCASYRLSKPAWGHKSALMPWKAEQQWFLCGRRLLGMITLRPLEDTSGAGVWGRLRFGMNKDIETGTNGLFKMGSLVFRILDHNFGGIETAPSETFFLDKPDRYRSRELLLKDRQALSGQEPPYQYKAGDSFFFVAEILPYWETLASEVTPFREGGVRGLAFTENGKAMWLLHNPADQPREVEVEVGAERVTVWQPGTEPRPAERACPDGVMTMTLPGHQAMLVEVRP